MSTEKDYVLGTHDDEITRLGLQHRVWRPRALDAWRRGGFTVGQTIIDVGCGPGHASTDLAEIVGSSGTIVAVDRSRRFLDSLDERCKRLGIGNVRAQECDFDESDLAIPPVDGAWGRWIFAFVKNPRQLLSRVTALVKPGGVVVLHEYLDYATWRLVPRCPAFDEFVRVVMKSWRGSGGEPNIGLDLSVWLGELGFEIVSILPIIDIVPPTNFVWQWPISFVDVNVTRLRDLGFLNDAQALAVRTAVREIEQHPHGRMVTPAVVEIIARRVTA